LAFLHHWASGNQWLESLAYFDCYSFSDYHASHFGKNQDSKAIRATSSNPELALASGINIDRVIWITWFIGAGLAAVAGVFRGAGTLVNPMTGWDIILPIFAVAILGGIGNYYGAIAAAFIIGLAENIGVVALTALKLSTEYRVAIAFLILIVTLLLRPQGLAILFRRA